MCSRLERGKHYPQSISGWIILIGMVTIIFYIQNTRKQVLSVELDIVSHKNLFTAHILSQLCGELFYIIVLLIIIQLCKKIYKQNSNIEKFINNL